MNRESGLGISVASIAAQSSGSRHGAIGRPSSTSITTARSMNTLTLVCAARAAIQANAVKAFLHGWIQTTAGEKKLPAAVWQTLFVNISTE
jgi:hypothetical protein